MPDSEEECKEIMSTQGQGVGCFVPCLSLRLRLLPKHLFPQTHSMGLAAVLAGSGRRLATLREKVE